MAGEPDYSALIHEHNGNIEAAAASIGLTYQQLRCRRYRQIRKAERGELGFEKIPPGFAVKTASKKLSDGTWARIGKEAGEVHQIPDGFAAKKENALTDSDGRLLLKWTSSVAGAASAKLLADVVRASFNDFVSGYERIYPPATVAECLLTQYVVGDHHLGLLAWRPEAGESYDLKIGERLLRDKMAELVCHTPPSHTAIFLNLGDFFHSNNTRNETEKSGNPLDVDGRYGKVLQVGIKLATACIEMLLAKHERVIVWWLIGNHDPQIALAAMLALWAWFRDESRVSIDFNPSKFCMLQHGQTMLVATHGDMLKPKDIVSFSASEWPKVWGATQHRYAAFGHVHHSARGGTAGKMTWESFETLAAKDAWHAGEGYQAPRSMTAVTYHSQSGEFSRNRVSVG